MSDILYNYQRDAVNRMKNGCILCGGVGSGKSRTALAYYVKSTDYKKDLYIITTARKRDTLEWQGDMCPFLLSTDEKINGYKNHVFVDSWNNIGKYTDVSGAFFIFDEQRVVGSGEWVKSFLKITKKNDWILLSATPGDKWEDYIPVFIANGFYKNRSEFKREHLVYAAWAKFPKVERYLNTRRLVRLRDSILVTMDFSRLTTPHHMYEYVDYDFLRYKAVVRTRQTEEGVPIASPTELCLELRKIVNTDISRREKVLDIVRLKWRAIIFYNFDYEREILLNLDYGEGFEVAEWNGHKHQPVPEGKKWVYLVQYNAGAEGWNCVRTDTVIFYSLNYSYKTMEQAAGRIDRLNTPYADLYYYHLQSRAPIDIAIERALKAKKDFNAGAFVRRG